MDIQEVKIFYQAHTVVCLRHRDNSVSDATAEEMAAICTDLMMRLGKCLYPPPPSSFKMGHCIHFFRPPEVLWVLQHKMMDGVQSISHMAVILSSLTKYRKYNIKKC
jgi:hypothetical protein